MSKKNKPVSIAQPATAPAAPRTRTIAAKQLVFKSSAPLPCPGNFKPAGWVKLAGKFQTQFVSDRDGSYILIESRHMLREGMTFVGAMHMDEATQAGEKAIGQYAALYLHESLTESHANCPTCNARTEARPYQVMLGDEPLSSWLCTTCNKPAQPILDAKWINNRFVVSASTATGLTIVGQFDQADVLLAAIDRLPAKFSLDNRYSSQILGDDKAHEIRQAVRLALRRGLNYHIYTLLQSRGEVINFPQPVRKAIAA